MMFDMLGVTMPVAPRGMRQADFGAGWKAARGVVAPALDEIRAEMENFAQYSRTVAEDAAGQNRQTWVERAEWADRIAGLATLDAGNARGINS